ncbi:partial heptose III glucuronosyltransferase, partial [Patescibacteria group bacterium]
MKKVSVLIPLYNKENFILETIFSVDRQITKDVFKIEVIIVNDCSTDRSLEIVKDYIWKNENVEVKIIENEVNLGPSASLNKALEVLSGDYVALLDADDVLTRYSLHSRFNALEKSNEYDWLSGLELRMEANGNIIVGREFVKYNPPVEQKEIINGLLTGELFLPTS